MKEAMTPNFAGSSRTDGTRLTIQRCSQTRPVSASGGIGSHVMVITSWSVASASIIWSTNSHGDRRLYMLT